MSIRTSPGHGKSHPEQSVDRQIEICRTQNSRRRTPGPYEELVNQLNHERSPSIERLGSSQNYILILDGNRLKLRCCVKSNGFSRTLNDRRSILSATDLSRPACLLVMSCRSAFLLESSKLLGGDNEEQSSLQGIRSRLAVLHS